MHNWLKTLVNLDQRQQAEAFRQHPILVIGGLGTVGWGLTRALRAQFGEAAVRVASRSGELTLDITDPRTIRRVINQVEPSLILHLAAMTNVNACEANPQEADLINVIGTKNVVTAAEGIPVVYFSSDFVFDGQSLTPYRETATPNPISVYGQSKYLGEWVMNESGSPVLILRISFPWYPVGAHLLEPKLKDTLWWMADQLVKGREVQAFTNVTGSFTEMVLLAEQFLDLVLKTIPAGIKLLHYACPQPATAYQLGLLLHQRLAAETGLASMLGQVVPVEFEPEADKTAARPAHGGLDSSLATSLGIISRPLEEAIKDHWLDVLPPQW